MIKNRKYKHSAYKEVNNILPTTNLISIAELTPRQLADQDAMTLLQHQKCHAAASSSATSVVTVGIASGRGERRGSERGKGEEGRK